MRKRGEIYEKLISTLLAAVMIASCMVTPAFAEVFDSSLAKVYSITQAPKMNHTKKIGPVTFSNFLEHTEYKDSKDHLGNPIKVQYVKIGMEGCMASDSNKADFIWQKDGFNAPSTGTYDYSCRTGQQFQNGHNFYTDIEHMYVKPFAGAKTGATTWNGLVWQFMTDPDYVLIQKDSGEYWKSYGIKVIDHGQDWYYSIVVTNRTDYKGDTVTPATPAPVKPVVNLPKEATANRATSSIYVNGKKIKLDAQEINGSNYFKLRDIAYVLNGTEKQFAVGWDNASKTISLTTNKPYVGDAPTFFPDYYYIGTGPDAFLTDSPILVDGVQKELYAYNITGNNFFKLRDLGQTFDFNVGWDSATQSVTIDTTKGYQ